MNSKAQWGQCIPRPARHAPTVYPLGPPTSRPSRRRTERLYITTFPQPPQCHGHQCHSRRCRDKLHCFCGSLMLHTNLDKLGRHLSSHWRGDHLTHILRGVRDVATGHLVWSASRLRKFWPRRLYASLYHSTLTIQSQLITGFFFDFQASHTQLSTAVLTSTSPQSEQTAGIVEPLTKPRSSYHLTPRTSSTLPIAQCTCLSESENKSPRVTTALRHIIRITTDVRPEGEKGLPLRRSTLKTLTAFLRGPPPLIGIILWVLMGSGPLILPPTHPAPSRHPFGAQSLRRKFSVNAMGSMERWMGSSWTPTSVNGTRTPSYAGLRTMRPLALIKIRLMG